MRSVWLSPVLYPAVVLGNVVRDGSSRPPHNLARTFFGSFQWGVIRDGAIGRGARCLWQGHQDGVKPEYVIVSQQTDFLLLDGVRVTLALRRKAEAIAAS